MELDVRWIADYRNGTHLSVQYCPAMDGMDQQTRESLHTPTMYRPFPGEVAGHLRMLTGLAETRLVRRPNPVEGRGWTVQPHVIERTVSQTYIGRTDGYWLRFDFFFVHPLGAHKRDWITWQEGELPEEIRTIVARVDEFAVREASSHWAKHYNEFAKREELKRFIPGPIATFISYRSEPTFVVPLAQRIHDALSAPGDVTFFRTFLDRPDLEAGPWREQLQRALETADLFVPLLTRNYEGGNALWELEIAEAAARAGRLQILPVLVEGAWGDYPRFDHLQGVQIPADADDQLFGVQVGRLRSLAVASAAVTRRS